LRFLVVQSRDEDLIEAVDCFDVGDLRAVGGKHAGFGAGRVLLVLRRDAAGLAGGRVGHGDAGVHRVGDPFAVGTPGVGGGNGVRVVGELYGIAALRGDRPELADAGAVFHEEGNALAVGGGAEPVARAAEAGVLAVGGVGQAALNNTGGWGGEIVRRAL